MSRRLILDDSMIAKIASLIAKGTSQKRIELQLRHHGIKISQPLISKAVKKALEMRLLVEGRKYTFVPDGLDEKTLKEIRLLHQDTNHNSEFNSLINRWNRCKASSVLMEIHALPREAGLSDGRDINKRIKYFSEQVAPLLAMQIERSDKVGISWGGSILMAVDALSKYLKEPVRKTRNIRFVPTVGEPFSIGRFAPALSSNLVGRLHAIFNGHKGKPLSLTGIPAVRPTFNDPVQDENIKHVFMKYLRASEDFTEIFGSSDEDKSALRWNLDSIITSAGFPDITWKMEGGGLFKMLGVDKALLRQMVLGDIGGVLIGKNQYEKNLQYYTNSWIGLSMKDYRWTASNAMGRKNTSKPSPGVILVVVGKKKAQITFELIKLRVVNRIYCDWELGNELRNLMDRELEGCANQVLRR